MRKTLVLSLIAAAAVGAGTAAIAQTDRPDISRAQVQERAAQKFARLDANQDGKLDAADRELHRETRHKAAFERLDADKDGQISYAEFTAQGEARGERRAEMREARGGRAHPGRARFALRGADTDGDGSISQAEFASAALARFDRADADKDGTVSAEERRALHREFRRPQPRGEAG
jgi:Ca2+-binding EF-hand superfamily protein